MQRSKFRGVRKWRMEDGFFEGVLITYSGETVIFFSQNFMRENTERKDSQNATYRMCPCKPFIVSFRSWI